MVSSTDPCPLCAGASTVPFAELHGRRYLRCPDCLLTFLSRRQLPDPNTEWERYCEHNNVPDDPGYRAFLSQLAEALLPHLRAGTRGLDYGCGPATVLAQIMADAGMHMSVYDPFFANRHDRLSATYDFVTCSETAEHFHHPRREFKRLDGLLRPGGWLGVMTALLGDDGRFSQWHYIRDPTHVVFYRRETMRWIAADRDWRVHFPGGNITLFQKSGDVGDRPDVAPSGEV